MRALVTFVVLLVVGVVGGASCGFSSGIPTGKGGPIILCHSLEDCPPTWSCDPRGICTPPDAAAAPSLASSTVRNSCDDDSACASGTCGDGFCSDGPAAGNLETTFAVDVVVAGSAGADPVAVLSDSAGNTLRTFALDPASASPHFRFTVSPDLADLDLASADERQVFSVLVTLFDARGVALPPTKLDESISIDIKPPSLSLLSIAPAAAGAGAHVTLQVSSTEALRAPPTLVFVDDANPFPAAPARSENDTFFEWDLDVDPQGPAVDGLFALAQVRAVDRAGNATACTALACAGLATGPLPSVLIDRQAPVLRLLSPAANLRVSEVAGFSSFDVGFSVNETVTPVVTLASLAATSCTPSGDVWHCTIDVPAPDGSVPEGTDAVHVVVTDRAGNVSSAAVDVLVDYSLPVAQVSDVTYVPAPGGLASSSFATLGASARIRVTTDEPVSAPIVVSADNNGTVFTATVDAAGVATIAFSNASAPFGLYALRAHLVDTVGHAGDVSLGSDLDYRGFVGPVCSATDDNGVAVCTDFDGDGEAGVGPGCAAGQETDCDDTNPFIRGGAVEIPGDGLDNDCAGGDLPVDESVGLFAAFDGIGAACTRGSPCSVSRAVADVPSDGTGYVFLAEGDYSGAGDIDATANLIGGFHVDAAGAWTRDGGAVSSFGGNHVAFHAAGGHLVAVGIETTANGSIIAPDVGTGDRLDLIECHAPFSQALTPSFILDSTIFHEVISVGAAGTIILGSGALGSRVTSLTVADAARVERTIITGSLGLLPSAVLDVDSSVLQSGGPSEVIDCSTSARARFIHDTIEMHNASTFSFGGCRIDLLNTAVSIVNDSSPTEPIFDGGTSFFIIGTDIDARPVRDLAPGMALLDPCSNSTQCLGANLVTGLLDLAPDSLHIDPGSPLRDGAQVTIWGETFGAPTSAVADLDGQCRQADGAPDIGADEAE